MSALVLAYLENEIVGTNSISDLHVQHDSMLISFCFISVSTGGTPAVFERGLSAFCYA